MNISIAQKIGTTFLSELDEFLARHYRQLRCRDIYDIYSKFFYDLKDFRGTSTGFTGLSEFLIFRFVIHHLGGSFKKRSISKDTAEFISGDLKIQQGLPVGGPVRYQPDIAVFKSGKLVAVIQIKTFLVNGWKTFEKERADLDRLMKHGSNNFRALLLVYDPYNLPQRLKQMAGRKPMNDMNKWFSWLLLKDNDDILDEILTKSLRL